jgi:adenosylcobinamide kinase/adenosylcobinamide-phosphate guanylyltransferase
MSATIYYITGGERSGKSAYAQQLALSLCNDPIYLATSRIWDDEFKQRVERHKNDRDERWQTIEEEIQISKHDYSGKTVVLDCVTLWLTNLYADNNYNIDKALEQAKTEWVELVKQDFNLIVISNEIGMGGHGATESQRAFTSLQGWMNQYIAKSADKAWLMVSGLAIILTPISQFREI